MTRPSRLMAKHSTSRLRHSFHTSMSTSILAGTAVPGNMCLALCGRNPKRSCRHKSNHKAWVVSVNGWSEHQSSSSIPFGFHIACNGGSVAREEQFLSPTCSCGVQSPYVSTWMRTHCQIILSFCMLPQHRRELPRPEVPVILLVCIIDGVGLIFSYHARHKVAKRMRYVLSVPRSGDSANPIWVCKKS